MPQRFSEEIREQWKNKILSQRTSGLSIVRWCQENNIVVHNFRYWQDKLFPKTIQDRSAFTEIPDKAIGRVSGSNETGITIEFQEIRIHLEKQFDLSALKQCLKLLKEI